MEHLFVISQASYFSPAAAMSSQVYHHSAENNLKTKHPRAFASSATSTQPPKLVKKEAFTQPLTKATSPIVKDIVNAKVGHHNDTHENTSSAGSDLPHNKLRASVTSTSNSTPPLSPASSEQFQLLEEEEEANAKADQAVLPAAVAEDLVNKTQRRMQHAMQKSTFLTHHGAKILATVPTFTMSAGTGGNTGHGDEQHEVVRRELLGQGGFAAIYSVDITNPERLRHHNAPSQQYVVKHLNSKLYDQNFTDNANRKLQLGAKDIVIESQMLAALNHPNIISLEGISTDGVHCFETLQRTDAYFMILPRLECTLAEKLSAWKHERLAVHHYHIHNSTSSSSKSSWWRRYGRRSGAITTLTQEEQRETEFLCERLQIIVDLCKALEYLHNKRIMHRDIKPPNIGFDKDGTLKLFDFGLAKEVPQLDPGCSTTTESGHSANSGSGFFGISTKPMLNAEARGCMGNTGTTRYMAPEIIRREPYTTKVDVYATSIVCWEVMTLLKPYGNDTNGQFVKECVALYDDRPTIPSGHRHNSKLTVWPKSLKKLVQQGWQRDQATRLTAYEMRKGLEQIVDKKKRLLSVMTASVTEQQSLVEESVPSAKLSTTTPPKPQQPALRRSPSSFQGVVTEIML